MHDTVRDSLDVLRAREPFFSVAGGLCVALVMSRRGAAGLPLDAADQLTGKGSMVRGLNDRSVQAILAHYRVSRLLHTTGGRTNPGSVRAMRGYVDELNRLYADGLLHADDMWEVEEYWAERVREHFAANPERGARLRLRVPTEGPFSAATAFRDLLGQADAMRRKGNAGALDGTMCAMASAALVAVHPAPRLSAVDGAGRPTFADDDAVAGDVSFQILSAPGAETAERCRAEADRGRTPVVLTVGDGTAAARIALDRKGLSGTAEVHDLADWLASFAMHQGGHTQEGMRQAVLSLMERHNSIVVRAPGLGAVPVDLPVAAAQAEMEV